MCTCIIIHMVLCDLPLFHWPRDDNCLTHKFSNCALIRKIAVIKLGPVVQSVISLTSSLRVISLTVLADSIYNILIFFAEKM